MRLTSETDHFPYGYPGLTCYIEANEAGELAQLRGRGDIRAAVLRAQSGLCTLYAVWPGKYRSDLFRVDDLDAMAEAVKA